MDGWKSFISSTTSFTICNNWRCSKEEKEGRKDEEEKKGGGVVMAHV